VAAKATLPDLHRRCLLQLLPLGSPDDASEPVAHLRLLSLLFHKPIPKHFNIIEKNGENAMSCNVFLADGAYASLPMACMGKNTVSRILEPSPTVKWQSPAIRQVYFRFKSIISHCFTLFFSFSGSLLSSDPQEPAKSTYRIPRVFGQFVGVQAPASILTCRQFLLPSLGTICYPLSLVSAPLRYKNSSSSDNNNKSQKNNLYRHEYRSLTTKMKEVSMVENPLASFCKRLS